MYKIKYYLRSQRPAMVFTFKICDSKCRGQKSCNTARIQAGPKCFYNGQADTGIKNNLKSVPRQYLHNYCVIIRFHRNYLCKQT